MGVGFVSGGLRVGGNRRVAKTSSKRRTSHVVAVAAAEKSSAVEEVLAKGFHSGVSDEAIDMMSFVRCHKSILGRGGLSVSQAQLFTKVDTANAWISVTEYETNASQLPGMATSKIMEEKIDDICSATIEHLSSKFSDVLPHDAAIFEFDMKNNILRIMSYGIAAHSEGGFLHERNVQLTKSMFEAVGLPEKFFGEGVKRAGKEVSKLAEKSDKKAVETAFDYFSALI
mmetsp:Transcript_28471/g.111570  ORF Transcript_28471/g.111570 Transcript_28471/m.111570 type:complete len:228 (-) Transcript_28471:331-1014(-)|eukprot:CAMPEP_0113967272 /NCGR_PEP_ID=MMETSP0011_2-20120614/8830_1 /TAXON_ID=101924 /ORGANISM="Rhodosorus marinus" /LENGTH=227 /DNA_ID=CAMNT_0000980121 /DNA_START=50 /DNA_END=733 /DNA_ORIENTATION=+ /assembly_acc=CAM_ASM_000156